MLTKKELESLEILGDGNENRLERIHAIANCTNPIVCKKAIDTLRVDDTGNYWLKFFAELPKSLIKSALAQLVKIHNPRYKSPIYGLLLNSELTQVQFDFIVDFSIDNNSSNHIEYLLESFELKDLALDRFLQLYASKEFVETSAIDRIPINSNTMIFWLKFRVKNYTDQQNYDHQLWQIFDVFPAWSATQKSQTNFTAMANLMCILSMSGNYDVLATVRKTTKYLEIL